MHTDGARRCDDLAEVPADEALIVDLDGDAGAIGHRGEERIGRVCRPTERLRDLRHGEDTAALLRKE